MSDFAIAAVLRRDRMLVASALLAIAVLAWAYILYLAAKMKASAATIGSSGMSAMSGMAMAPQFAVWTAAHALFIFLMWAVMMVGMMTPSAAPVILIYTQVARQARTNGAPFAPAVWFAGGYLLAWTGFAAVATAAQFGLEGAMLLSPMMAGTSRWLGVALLIAFGLYQWMPFKSACLSQCRAPLSFVQAHGGFHPAAWGSLRLGLLHGLYCIGCCWALMALLFVGGVMNVLWIAAIMLLVLAEKLLPGGQYIARASGLAAIVAGGWMLA